MALPSNEILNIKFAAAVAEIAEQAQMPLSVIEIEEWLTNHNDLFQAVNETICPLPVPVDIVYSRDMVEFDLIFRRFTEILAWTTKKQDCEIALAELKEANTEGWIKRYAELFNKTTGFLGCYNNGLAAFESYGIRYKILLKDFQCIYEFGDTYCLNSPIPTNN